MAKTNNENFVVLISPAIDRAPRGKVVPGPISQTGIINVINYKTGEKIYRKGIGRFIKIIAIKGDKIIYQYDINSYVLYYIKNGSEIAFLGPQTLPKLFKELSIGLERCGISEKTYIITATAKDGKTYFIDPFMMKIFNDLSYRL